MNCANHADASAVAYCRTCGKALCANCTRPVRGVIYCEDCLGAKMEGAVPGGAGFVSGTAPAAMPGASTAGAPAASGGPNPTVAGILGAIPFGIGAVYNGQYAKGLAHLGIFALLVAGCNSAGEVLPTISGFGIAFLVLYGIIDSVRSARAIQAGLPAPDPYGLAATFGGGAKIETSKIPMGAIVLILLGVLFLLHTMGFGLGLDRFWPLILIVLGGWLLARNWGLVGSCCAGCGCARCRSRRLMGPAMLLTIGFLFLLENLHVSNLGFHRTWPVILLVVGAVKLLQGSASVEGHIPSLAPGAYPAGGPIPPAPPVPPVPPVPPTSEVNRG
ncbi:MAG: DUF5668 domain-containing protein [Terriglobales bacterium]